MPWIVPAPGGLHLDWPFFELRHRDVWGKAVRWAGQCAGTHSDESRVAVDAACKKIVADLGAAGLLDSCIGDAKSFDARAICLSREALAYYSGLADFSFAMQGLGSGAISLFGTAVQRAAWLGGIARGKTVAAFALSESGAGSDVAGMQCRARRDGDDYLLDGTKTWISNGGIADIYCVFARTEEPVQRDDGATAARGISAFIVESDRPGFSIDERIDVIAPHPLATLGLRNCRVPAVNRIGEEGQGFGIAMATLDVFRSSVAAAALGFARRALAEALAHVGSRRMFGKQLVEFQMTQASLAEMATAIDAAALLTYRAAWLRDRGEPVTAAAAMAKLTATESAQQVIDRAVQLFGGRGVQRGETVEKLYREIRALRIYEGASEVQKLIISRELIKQAGVD
jgi:acyl-CoA dehydrogenase